jgi:hypothetical protein
MPTRDNATNTKTVIAISAGTKTASGDGITIDTQGYDRVSFKVSLGPSGDTLSGTTAIELDIAESTDGSTWNYAGDYDIVAPYAQSTTHEGIGVANGATNSGAFFLATSTATVALVNSVQPVVSGGYIGTKRYVRLRYQITGTHTNGTPVSAIALLSGPTLSPVGGNAS